MSKQPDDLIFGLHPVEEALESGKEIEKLLIARQGKSPVINDLVTKARSLQIPVQFVPQEKLNRVTAKNHQGVIAFLSALSFSSLDNVIDASFSSGKPGILLILDRITDVRNFGAIARTAECAGVNAIIIPEKNTARLGSDAMKTSAGALNHIPVCRVSNLTDVVKYVKNCGFSVVACTEKGSSSVYDMDYSEPVAIVMGSEEDGISDELLKKSDYLANIPMYGKINSLNVSVASSIILYEAIRQRRVVPEQY